MNNKFFVPYETAKALKEKDYPNDTEMLYDNETGELISSAAYADPKYWIGDKYMYLIAAPTYHEVVDWLEGKGIYVTTFWSLGEADEENTYKIWWKGFIDIPLHVEESTAVYPTREEALNAAILKVLEMI